MALRIIPWVALLIGPWAWLQARPGAVVTREGNVCAGQIRLESGALRVVNAAEGFRQGVAASNLWLVLFEPAEEEARSAGPAASPAFWQGEDVGQVPQAGRARLLGGVFHLQSAGTNIAGADDAFHFLCKPVRGNSELVARILEVRQDSPWARAGLMMRQDLASDAPYVFLAVTAGPHGVWQWRDQAGATAVFQPVPDLPAPHWVRLRRDGDRLTGYRSRNGREWARIETIHLPISEKIQVGLAVTGWPEEATLGGARGVRARADHLREGPSLSNRGFAPRLVLQSGSVLLDPIAWADDTLIHFSGVDLLEPVPTSAVASFRFDSVPARWHALVSNGRPGALLAAGDFVEGRFVGMDRGRLRLDSVLFGQRTFDPHHELRAVILRKPAPFQPVWEVKTDRGSVWFGARLEIRPDEVILDEPSAGRRALPIHQLREIRFYR